MSKLVTLLIAAFAFASTGAFAESHGADASADGTEMEEQHDMTDGAAHDCEALTGEAKDECERAMEEDKAMSGEMDGGMDGRMDDGMGGEKMEGEKGAY